MELDGNSREQFHDALLSAFPNKGTLKQMVSFKLNINLDNYTDGNLSKVVRELIELAEANGNVKELLTAARKANPGNPKLRSFDELMRSRWNPTPVTVNSDSDFEYDIALSFAGEERYMAERLFHALQQEDIKVFYDQNEESELWGEDLSLTLPDIYENKARFCIMLFSQHYVNKEWTKLELNSALKRKWSKNVNNILPLNVDNTPAPPEFPDTILFLPFPNINGINVKRVVDNVKKKLGKNK
ncbi:MAG: toll/interleukin-1 receptor domain-containing protein [Cyanobacteria bacterium J06635_10]